MRHDVPEVERELTQEELEEEDRRWEASFAKSRDFLDRMAEKVAADYKTGRTEPLDFDRL